VDDQLLPPYAAPTGPLNDDAAVVRAFARGTYVGHSERFHVEGPALMVDRMDSTAVLRIGPDTLLVRLDLPDDQLDTRLVVEQVLTEEGFTCLDRDNLLGAAVAIQVIGVRLSSWDLWGKDLDEGFRCLRTAAVGDDWNPILAQGPS
jgi:hypothetical protein